MTLWQVINMSLQKKKKFHLPPGERHAANPERPGGPAGGGAASLGWCCKSSPSKSGAVLARRRCHRPKSWGREIVEISKSELERKCKDPSQGKVGNWVLYSVFRTSSNKTEEKHDRESEVRGWLIKQSRGRQIASVGVWSPRPSLLLNNRCFVSESRSEHNNSILRQCHMVITGSQLSGIILQRTRRGMTLGRPTSYSGFPSVGLILLYQHVRFRTPPIPPPAAAAAANWGSESKSTNSQTLSVQPRWLNYGGISRRKPLKHKPTDWGVTIKVLRAHFYIFNPLKLLRHLLLAAGR